MPEFDIKQLLGSLDEGCRDVLEKASRFCLQHNHREVTVEHVVLHLLADKSYPLYRQLEEASENPIELIKQLLQTTDRLKLDKPCQLIFSRHLLEWFADTRSSILSSGKQRIEAEDLVRKLIEPGALYRGASLSALKSLDPHAIEARIKPADEFDPTMIVSAGTDVPADDATLLITDPSMGARVNRHVDDLRIDGYDDFMKIGEGGMARVYRARHLGLERNVALKVLNAGTDSETISRFMREARIVAQLNHANIIQIYDVNQARGQTYLAMELISGGELSDIIDAEPDLKTTIDILVQVLSALHSAHDKGYIHRDIKPANILLREDRSVVLTDFGIARSMGEDSGLTVAGSILGTPRYMSPEQARGEALDHRSDLYSVGVLFYQMIEGKLPYVGESAIGTAMKHILDPVPQLSCRSRNLQPFIDMAMAKKSTDRFQTAAEMIKALKSLMTEADPIQTSATDRSG